MAPRRRRIKAFSLMNHRVAVLSFSRIARDRRVQRQCDLLAEMGAVPIVIGYGTDAESVGHAHRFWPTPRPDWAHRIKTVLRQLPAHLGETGARLGFWARPEYRWALEQLLACRCSSVVANDWPALVVAARWKAETGGRVHYDTHEFATLEFDERWSWRIIYKPFVTQLERAAILAADHVSTVGPKLAEALQEHYRLPKAPLVVRNIPEQIELSDEQPTQWPLRLLYHGQVLEDRGLEALIDSIPLWEVPHRLTIRGDGNPAYIERLRRRVADRVSDDRVSFEPAVAPGEVMRLAASTADVGVHFTPLETKQRHFSLPNKLFEYVGAGLAVAVSPGADLRQIVEDYRLGVVSVDAGPGAVAEAINGLTHAKVVSFRENARRAAIELCWERERDMLQASFLTMIALSANGRPPRSSQ